MNCNYIFLFFQLDAEKSISGSRTEEDSTLKIDSCKTSHFNLGKLTYFYRNHVFRFSLNQTKMVNTIRFRFDLTRFRKRLLCVYSNKKKHPRKCDNLPRVSWLDETSQEVCHFTKIDHISKIKFAKIWKVVLQSAFIRFRTLHIFGTKKWHFWSIIT